MADMMNTLKTLLGDNADEKIKQAMSMLQSSGLVQQTAQSTPQSEQNVVSESEKTAVQTAPSGTQQQQVLTPEGIAFLGQIRSMIDQISNTNDSRSELLRSLKPFMRSGRQQTIDRAIRIMNIGRISGLFGK